MLKIKLTQDAYVEGYEGAFYRLHTYDGKLSALGIQNNWYTANAIDEKGNEYKIVWAITNREAFERGDEDCCDWDNPSEIYSYADGKTVEAEIEW